MGKRVEDNKEVATEVEGILKDLLSTVEPSCTNMSDMANILSAVLLCDISKSLAIIADRCSRTESAEDR